MGSSCDKQDERPLFIIFLFGAFLYSQLNVRPQATTAIKESVQRAATEMGMKFEAKLPKKCGDVVNNCVATAVVSVPGCNLKIATEMLNNALASPLTANQCKKADSDLRRSCPLGCAVDPAEFLIIAGKVSVDLPDDKDSDGNCNAKGKRPVTLRAICKR